MIRKGILITCLLALLPLLAGCWDRVEIQDRAFVQGIGIDTVDGEPYPADRFLVTLEIPKLTSSAGQASGEGGDGGTWILSGTGPSVFGAIRELATRSNLTLFMGHTRLLVIGEEAAKTDLSFIIDLFERQREFTRRFRVVVADGKAKDIAAVKPPSADLVSMYVYDAMEPHRRSNRFVERGYGEFVQQLRETGASYLPRVTAGNTDLKVAGSAVFSNWRMVGWLGEEETTAVALVDNEVYGGGIDIEDYPRPGDRFAFEVSNAKAKVTPSIVNGRPRFEIEVYVEGRAAEAGGPRSFLSLRDIKTAEYAVADHLEKSIRGTVAKLQHDLKADILKFGWLLSKYEPQEWERLQDNWEEEFARSQIDVTVQVKIRSVGKIV